MREVKQPLVTIAIPTYNRAAYYLPQALKSALSQTYSNIEIIVSDNCSTDNTVTVVKSFNDKRIRYMKQPRNVGLHKNCNFCLEQANGVFFLMLHDDDLIDDDFVEFCIKAMNGDHSIGVVMTGIRVIDAEGNIKQQCHNRGKGLSTGEFFLNWFAGKVPLYFASTLYNTKRLKDVGGLNSKTNWYLDVVPEVKLMDKYGRVDVYDIKASNRQHGKNAGSSAAIREWCEDSLYLLDVICQLASEKKTFIRNEGMRYFCNRNYRRVARLQSPLIRFLTYLFVYKTFKYQLLPPPLGRIIYGHNPFLNGLRSLRRRLALKS